jgi:hypothetical protein
VCAIVVIANCHLNTAFFDIRSGMTFEVLKSLFGPIYNRFSKFAETLQGECGKRNMTTLQHMFPNVVVMSWQLSGGKFACGSVGVCGSGRTLVPQIVADDQVI